MPSLRDLHPWRSPDQAEARLKGVAIVGQVDARNKAVVHLSDGSLTPLEQIEGMPMGLRQEHVLRVDDTAVITLSGLSVDPSAIAHYESGAIVELAEGDDPKARIAAERERAAKLSRYESQACAGVLDCFLDHESFGSIDLHLAMPIGPDGHAKTARLVRSTGANPAAKVCLQKLASERVITPFDGPPGALECILAGNITPGSRMMNISQRYVVDDSP